MVKRFIPILCSVACSFSLVSAQEAPSDASLFKDADKVNELGFNILKDIAQKNSGNIAISPLSLRSVFLPIQKATAGDTLKQINHAMGNADNFVLVYQHYMNRDEIKLSSLMSIDQNITLLPSFKKNIPASWFQICDFKNKSTEEHLKLCDWISTRTDNLITNMPPKGTITPDSRLIAINTLVFQAKWLSSFDPTQTRSGIFHSPKGAQTVNMMSKHLSTVLIDGPEQSQVIFLPYQNTTSPVKKFSLVIFLPDKQQRINEFILHAKWNEIASLLKTHGKYKTKEIALKMPRFSIKGKTIDLVETLKSEGIHDLFSLGKADFSNMTSSLGLFCNTIIQQCFIEANEEETKAAAASMVGIAWGGEPPLPIVVNRPFLWFIYDHEFDLILFCGTYTGPDE